MNFYDDISNDNWQEVIVKFFPEFIKVRKTVFHSDELPYILRGSKLINGTYKIYYILGLYENSIPEKRVLIEVIDESSIDCLKYFEYEVKYLMGYDSISKEEFNRLSTELEVKYNGPRLSQKHE